MVKVKCLLPSFLISVLTLSSISAYPQYSKYNVSTGVGIGFPFNQPGITKAGLSSTVSFVLMVNKTNGLLFQTDFVRFKNKSTLSENKFANMSLGYRRLFTEKFYTQFSAGAITIQSLYTEGKLAASFGLRTGYIFRAGETAGYDISFQLIQTTNKYGWVAIQLGGIIGSRKSSKK